MAVEKAAVIVSLGAAHAGFRTAAGSFENVPHRALDPSLEVSPPQAFLDAQHHA
jgi:hypothetical protein